MNMPDIAGTVMVGPSSYDTAGVAAIERAVSTALQIAFSRQ